MTTHPWATITSLLLETKQQLSPPHTHTHTPVLGEMACTVRERRANLGNFFFLFPDPFVSTASPISAQPQSLPRHPPTPHSLLCHHVSCMWR